MKSSPGCFRIIISGKGRRPTPLRALPGIRLKLIARKWTNACPRKKNGKSPPEASMPGFIPGETNRCAKNRIRLIQESSNAESGSTKRITLHKGSAIWRAQYGNGPPVPKKEKKSPAADCGTIIWITNTAKLLTAA